MPLRSQNPCCFTIAPKRNVAPFTAMSEPEKQDDSISESIQDPTQFDADQYPQGMKLVAVVLSLILCMFVASMDNVSARISIQIKSKDRG